MPKETKSAREKRFTKLVEEAHAAGKAAAKACVPVPMRVGYSVIEGGACGFANVTVLPGTSSFARWWKVWADTYKPVGGGVAIWIHAYGQSVARKGAYARAYAYVLRAGGICAIGNSYLD
jgi:hypothetical protein